MYNQLSLWEEPKAESQKHGQQLFLPDAEIIMYRDFFNNNESNEIFAELYGTINWKQEVALLFGKQVAIPRLSAWYGDAGKSYTYSKIKMEPNLWTPTLITIKSKIEAIAGTLFNSVLLNLYRDGKDSVAWHSDDESELGENPAIGSLSFGATRRFMLRHKYQKQTKLEIQLTPGSLLLMKGRTQHFWQHQIPKAAKVTEPRINLTFRKVS
ncbi:alpha-ketoglutarate-dependent dioxygenase AlkB [Microcoleus sp. Pol11C2]|uniref:alpha-ketoglutarate-dependent dioxygenase AlkB n=1 Tax=Microcoleus sp. Pol11C2 TaxID=3055389 RepID=UPI002FD55309